MPDHSTDFDSMNEDALQAALDDANARKDAAKAEAVEITRALDAVRTRERLIARLGDLSDAERAALRGLSRRDAVAAPETVGAEAGAIEPEA